MTEDHIAEAATAYWSGELDATHRARVETHLGRCAACRAEFDAVRVALAALSDWPRDPRLDTEVERRLVASLRRPRVRAWARRAAAAAVVAAAGAAGFATGRATAPRSAVVAPPADTTLNTYLLLLEESAPTAQPSAGRDAYRAWARTLRAEHRLVSAEKLTDEPGLRLQPDGRVLQPDGSERAAHVSGWFLLRARSYDEAVALARRGPHLRHGSVLIRQVD